MTDNKLDLVVKMIKEEYVKALMNRYVFNPLSYALYKVWKMVNEKGR